MIICEKFGDSIKRIMIIVTFFCFNLDFIFSQDNFQCLVIQNSGNILKTITKDFNYIMTSPSRMLKINYLHLLMVSGITSGFVFYLDEKIDKEYVINKNTPFVYTLGNKFAEIGKEYGKNNDRVFYLFGGITTSLYAGSIMLKIKNFYIQLV